MRTPINKPLLTLLLVLVASAAWAESPGLEISAPLFPDVLKMYAAEGKEFPQTQETIETLASETFITQDELLAECRAQGYSVVAPEANAQLSEAERNQNYIALAICAYELHTAKPYYIPALVDQADICSLKLGGTWRMITEDDVNALDGHALTLYRRILRQSESASNMPLYNTMNVYIRGTDGQLKIAYLDLELPKAERIANLPDGIDWTVHLEPPTFEPTRTQDEPIVMRCVREVDILVL